MEKQQVSPLYQVSFTCPNCTYNFMSSKVRTSFIKTQKTDTDFCIHYAGVNPDFYLVRVCPCCGFSFTDNFKARFTPVVQQRIENLITKKWNHKDYRGERSLQDALTVYKIALLCAQLLDESDVVIGGLCFKIACFYRFQEDTEQELRFLQNALDCYMEFFQNESNVQVDEAKMIYLMAELQRRLGDYRGAIKWFDRVIKDKSITNIAIIKKAREQWQVAKEQLKELETTSHPNVDSAT
ncbi:hypothetical protein BHU72_10350 [Desulfuribacillus stibiiarsenatis]|uniref:DUF2225 domain-containing protein n=1 Tax=Desulfuribacillus stibiiarsenatis TaxID=1390249 RepID=A0A1E5L9N6_9FIRM|nr:DUF2225 domain-containing protein [Desulfuribacillus stibiiarsenatis]OEH86643.1 hypothetical protein BHU72_10350 [Desulfuribacillus stibiiarsenatis]